MSGHREGALLLRRWCRSCSWAMAGLLLPSANGPEIPGMGLSSTRGVVANHKAVMSHGIWTSWSMTPTNRLNFLGREHLRQTCPWKLVVEASGPPGKQRGVMERWRLSGLKTRRLGSISRLSASLAVAFSRLLASLSPPPAL